MSDEAAVVGLVRSVLAVEDPAEAYKFLVRARELQPEGVLGGTFNHGDDSAKAFYARRRRQITKCFSKGAELGLMPRTTALARQFDCSPSVVHGLKQAFLARQP